MSIVPDSTTADALAAAGYWVFPVFDHLKSARKIKGRDWGEILDEGEGGRAFLRAVSVSQHLSVTGWALCPQETDPIALLIIDADVYSAQTPEAAWAVLCPGEGHGPPAGTGVVRSASGGWHFYLQLPPGTDTASLKAAFKWEGISGEIRVSGKARRLIILPGSVAHNKQNRLGHYIALSPIVPVQDLAVAPSGLLARLGGRVGGADDREAGRRLPTEALHLLGWFRTLVGSIPEGVRNATVSQVGQVLGRLGPAEKPTAEILSSAWTVLHDHLGDFPYAEYEKALSSGFRTGRRNAGEYQSRAKNPTLTDVDAECEAIYGGRPWLIEILDGRAQTKEFLLGMGGSAERREEADNVLRLRQLSEDEILSTLQRLCPGTDPDTVAQSPLMVQPGWRRVLYVLGLMGRRHIERIGHDPEERFYTLLEEWARTAAGDGHFSEVWNARDLAPVSIIVEASGATFFAIKPNFIETLLTQVGDIPAGRKLLRRHFSEKSLRGVTRDGKIRYASVEILPELAQAYIRAEYQKWMQRNAS